MTPQQPTIYDQFRNAKSVLDGHQRNLAAGQAAHDHTGGIIAGLQASLDEAVRVIDGLAMLFGYASPVQTGPQFTPDRQGSGTPRSTENL